MKQFNNQGNFLRFICLGLLFLFFWLAPSVKSQSIDALRNNLQNQIQQIQEKINLYQDQIKQKEKEAQTLKREIGILEAQVAQTELLIKQTDLAIQETELIIKDKEKELKNLGAQIDQEKAVLAEYLRTIYEYDQVSLTEIILEKQNFSDFFEEVQSLEILQAKVKQGLGELQNSKNKLEEEKKILEDRKEEQSQLRALQTAQKKSSQARKQQKDSLLKQTKGQEALFQKMMDKGYSDIASIKNQLYLLEGVGLKMTLEEAFNHAKFVSTKTGVRPAFLLAILKKESSWGTNVGTGFWRSDMRPIDQKAFVDICAELNLDPDKMPVSRKPSYGWGGAMGPAQFLPTTWQAYKAQVASLTGHQPPNPWDIDDAFTASSIKLANNGASQGGFDAEWKAAMIYFAGSNWSNPLFRFYGDQVMDLAKVIQDQLDIIAK